MKTFKLINQAVLLTATMMFFACDGDQGQPGPTGPQGQQGVPGEDGADGADGQDGQDGNVNSFYFQNGFKGYDGTEDITIYNQADLFVEEDLFEIPGPNNKNLIIINGDYSSNTDPDSIHTLMKFNNLKEVIDAEYETDICSEDFYINEAVIYLSGVNDAIDASLMQVGFYGNESPIFDEGFVTWDMANQTEPWDSIGGKEQWQYNDPYLDLIGITQNYGYLYQISGLLVNRMPVYIPRDVAQNWICENNPGVLFSYIEGDIFLVFYSSENDNQDARPMLYLNIERNDDSANRNLISEEEAYENWKNKSYEEKMKPFYEAHPQLK